MQLDNPRSFDKCYISFVSFYTDFTFHYVLSVQVVVINVGGTDESVISIPRGTYDIETSSLLCLIAKSPKTLVRCDRFLSRICTHVLSHREGRYVQGMDE